MRSRSPSNFCSQCGSSLSPGDSFCSQCGSAVDPGGSDSFRSQHSRHTQNSRHPRKDGFRRRIEDLTVEGWDLKQDYGDRVVMINRGFGSIPLHIILLATTSGVGNLLYAWYCYSPGAERIELREDGSEEYFEDEGFPTDWTVKRALAFAVSLIFGSLGVLFGLFLLLTNWAGAGLVFGTLSLLLGLFLLVLTPQHVPGIRSPTTFGRVRSTDEKTVYEPATPCSVCAKPVGNGVKRQYHERNYVAGVPVKTANEGENYYCRSCARGDVDHRTETGLGEPTETEFV
ncbi:zinc ribbon domain-containing protein [Haladaptatus sp. R4]|uniref:zinc ribbon domain-containing protein n=1 Tax=Haladaptatus sp. R4 TaxID=1679489 RepID=UPI0012372D58|nr:zinc ribbon domain-containing protein [Haladaptatus sp. R4]